MNCIVGVDPDCVPNQRLPCGSVLMAVLCGLRLLSFLFGQKPPQHVADARELLDEPNLPTYSCLLIDYYLPDLDGLGLLAKLRSRGVALPAILVTGHPSLALRRRVGQAGIRLMEKPLIGDGLADRIRDSLQEDHGGQ